ncbi:MAG: SAM-dependent methyltransferase [Polyangiaceae bacterium]|nr:SAM-dependent methyltransferase [Polyangiaceae bacterium]NUQ75004.1 SAM-dependent methyltransferase [Polyangiaceae bacterium]
MAPNTARIIDFWLGGAHHTHADRESARAFEEACAEYPAIFQGLRRYIGRACRFVADAGVDQFCVFGAGVPACGNVHEVVPNARVLYTDIDRENIALGREILSSVHRTGYVYCDAADLSTLDPEEVRRTLGPIRRLGLVFVGVAAFIPDDKLRDVFEQLYAWAPPGSYMVLDFDTDSLMPHTTRVLEMMEAIGAPLILRTREEITPLLGRWRVTEGGIQPVTLWPNLKPEADQPTFMFGSVVYKPA